ncbi:flagellar basal body rod protein FlgB [Pararoseomonas indoligenes]|uniref:Flagellar basal body rod protein FlgB n=1 Tax=Roseomonas indoligenes TaxID=2820811 RepID=A0A940MZD9_9PROT|nr:flagellar basal body protein [Pararoseomonas indoligenes]MBP0492485.1 flagellar biosynthesis protein FlgB [Pararoseomonas indoligenes]
MEITGKTPSVTSPMNLAETRLRWLDRRQEVLSRNIANADTPGYRARDLAPFAAHLARATAPRAMSRTDPRHLTPAGSGDPAARTAPAEEVSPNGNAISLDEQALKVADTDSAHALAMGLYKSWTGMFRTALGRNG